MILYLVVNKNTGEFEDNCAICSIGVTATVETMNMREMDENHVVLELTPEEYDAMNSNVELVADSDNNLTRPEYTKKIAVASLTPEVKDRPVVDDMTKPIEVDNGKGGKDIIGYEKKPVSFLVDKEKDIKVGKP